MRKSFKSFKQIPNVIRLVLAFTMLISQLASALLSSPGIAFAAPLFAVPATVYGNPIPLVPAAYTSTIVAGRTDIAGSCTFLTCSVTNTPNVVNATTTDFGNMTITLGVAGTVRLSVAAGTTIPAGYKAGFRVNSGTGLINLNSLGSVHIKTYLADVLREDVSDPAQLDVSLFDSSSDNNISIVTTQSFDEIQLEVNTLIDAGISWNVYYALVQEPFIVTTAPGGITNGLVSWVKADAGISGADGTAVAIWINQIPTGYDFTQATGSAQPTYYATTAAKLLNFNPVVDFDGTADYLRNTTQLMPSSSAYTFLAVGVDEDAVASSYRKLFGSEALADYFGLYKQGGAASDNGWVPYAVGGSPDRGTMGKGTKYSVFGGANGYWNGTNFTSDSRTSNAQPQIVGFNSLNSAVADPFYTWTDGYKENPGWSPLDDGLTSQNQFFSQTSIGADINLEMWKGRIPEFLVFDRALSDSEMQQVNSYLAIKYAVTLGQGNGSVGADGNNVDYIASDGTTKIWDATANTTYKNNITGIGRDDDSVLNQKQSRSVNTGIQPVIGLGMIAATNTANTNTFSTDKNYEVWGDNAGALTLSANYNGGTNNRLARIWKVQETGTIGTVKVQIPTAVAAGLQSIIVHTNSTFATLDRSFALTVNGSNYEADVDFNNGDFFTFSTASADTTPPSAPVISSPTPGSSTNDSTPTVSGTAEAGSTVTVKDGSTTVCTATANGLGAWSCTLGTALSAGSHSITATATDPAGNSSSASAANSITVDLTAPITPIISSPTSGSTTTDLPTISGTAEAGSTVTVKDGSTVLCTAVADTSGNWSCTPTLPLSEGSHALTATARDAASNVSSPTSLSITVDSNIITGGYRLYLPIISN